MGMIDFVKGAGERLLDINPGMRLGRAIAERIRKYRLGKDDLEVEDEGDKIVLRGSAGSQAEREKIVLAAGNVQGVARVEDQLKVAGGAAAEPPAQFYTVVKGDTLSRIAKQFYGSAQKYNRIFEANRPLLKHPDKIYPGQVLRIPAPARDADVARAS
jgi:nucleoid-associated protein YgaU